MRYRIEWRINPESRRGYNIVDVKSGKDIGRAYAKEEIPFAVEKAVDMEASLRRLHIVASHGRRIEEQ